jgi:hypothetical protein
MEAIYKTLDGSVGSGTTAIMSAHTVGQDKQERVFAIKNAEGIGVLLLVSRADDLTTRKILIDSKRIHTERPF